MSLKNNAHAHVIRERRKKKTSREKKKKKFSFFFFSKTSFFVPLRSFLETFREREREKENDDDDDDDVCEQCEYRWTWRAH
jgi:hypothetical protein